MKRFDIITLFPETIEPYAKASMLGRAQKQKLIAIKAHQLRKYSRDRHHRVDDTPYGGGAGMVMMVDPIFKAVKSIKKSKKSRIVLLSAKGKVFNQKKAQELSKYDQLTFICGRYEGVDERVARNIADEELSIGEYVLFGGEVATMVVMEAVSRLIPGVVAKEESIEKESFSNGSNREHPQYTRPDVYIMKGKKLMVPKVLLSGDHKKIVEWREKNSK